MRATTQHILSLADELPGGRESFLDDIAHLLADRQYFSPDDLAARYRVSLSTIKHWKATGLITPSLKIDNGTSRYTLEDLAKFEQQKGEKK